MEVTLDRVTHVGPARVLAVGDGRVLVAAPEFKAWAVLALAYGYRPVEGDLLLVAGQNESFWVIGVLAGSGATVLTAPGDLELSAPRGTVRISGGDGVQLRGGEVEIGAQTLRISARSLVETLGRALRRVKERFTLRARETRIDVDEAWKVRAGAIDERARGDVDIDGEQIRLG